MMIAALALTAVSTASAANWIGGSIGSGATVHYQTDLDNTSAIRYGLNLSAANFNFNILSIGGGVDYLKELEVAGASNQLTPYFGAGVDAYTILAKNVGGGIVLYPHALLGAKYDLNSTLNVFGEVHGGFGVALASGASGVGGVGFNARLGLNYRMQ